MLVTRTLALIEAPAKAESRRALSDQSESSNEV